MKKLHIYQYDYQGLEKTNIVIKLYKQFILLSVCCSSYLFKYKHNITRYRDKYIATSSITQTKHDHIAQTTDKTSKALLIKLSTPFYITFEVDDGSITRFYLPATFNTLIQTQTFDLFAMKKILCWYTIFVMYIKKAGNRWRNGLERLQQ